MTCDTHTDGKWRIAFILAAGKGLRFGASKQQKTTWEEGAELPKQFETLGGKPLWLYSYQAYLQHDGIDEVVLVSRPEYQQLIEEACHLLGLSLPKLLWGGEQRSDSSLKALRYAQQRQEELASKKIELFIHDAARPLVSQRIISDCISQLGRCNAVLCALAVRDSVILVDEAEHKRLSAQLERSCVRLSQTPQAFSLETLAKAFELAVRDTDFSVSDDISVVQRYLPGEAISVVEGEEKNLKLTFAEDLMRLELYLRSSELETEG